MAVSLRLAVDGDRPGIFAVHLRAVRETCSRSYSPQQIAAWTNVLSVDDYTTLMRRRLLVVATDADTVVGFGQLDPDAGEIDAVYVLPQRQGEGIGRRLLSELERLALLRGLRRLAVSATLNATGFYERAGYARRHVAVHRTLTGVQLACVRMGKTLEPSRSRPDRRHGGCTAA
jgi:GNAT superfamily N-acetyltransferase